MRGCRTFFSTARKASSSDWRGVIPSSVVNAGVGMIDAVAPELAPAVMPNPVMLTDVFAVPTDEPKKPFSTYSAAVVALRQTLLPVSAVRTSPTFISIGVQLKPAPGGVITVSTGGLVTVLSVVLP